jgi:hypothetical protein
MSFLSDLEELETEHEFFSDLKAMKKPWVPTQVGDKFSISGSGYSIKDVYVLHEVGKSVEFGEGWDIMYLLDGTPKKSYVGFIHSESLRIYAGLGHLYKR